MSQKDTTHPLPSFRSLDACPSTPKGWGAEIEIVNLDYCGKILSFKSQSKLSMHWHRDKAETFLVSSGKIIFRYIDTSNASILQQEVSAGMVIDIPVGLPHQIEALEDSVIIEFSTHHKDSDSYRCFPGNSQQRIT